jgi:hypothetical protein
MNLAKKYIKFVNDAHVMWTEFLILVPSGIVSYLFFPEVEYTLKLMVSGTICSVLVIMNFVIGVYSLTKRDYLGFVNFVFLPIFCSAFILTFVYN